MTAFLALGLMHCVTAIEQKLLDVPVWITPLDSPALHLDLRGKTVALTRDDRAVARINHESGSKYKLAIRGKSVCHKKHPDSTMGACSDGKNKARTWKIEKKHGGYSIKSTKWRFLEKLRQRCLTYDSLGNLKIQKCVRKKVNQLFDIRCADPSVCGSEKDDAETPLSPEEKGAGEKAEKGSKKGEECIEGEDETFRSSSFSTDSDLFGMDPQVPKIMSKLPEALERSCSCSGDSSVQVSTGTAQYPSAYNVPQCVCIPAAQGAYYAYPSTYAAAQ